MTLTRPRLLRPLALFLAVVVLGLTAYPGTLAAPYVAEDSDRYQHRIVPETAAAYNETVERARTYEYDALSPTAQTFVDRTRAAPDDEYTPTVCRDFLLICDAYTRRELPSEFTYGTELDSDEASYVIVTSDTRFLLQTGLVGHGWFTLPIHFLTVLLSMVPLGLLIGTVALTADSKRRLGGAIGAGLLATGLGLATPYLELAGLIDARTVALFLVAGVWLGLFVIAGRRIYRRLWHSGG